MPIFFISYLFISKFLITEDADTLDTYHAGNESGQIPVSNGTLNVGLNADKLDGNEASAFLKETDVITGTLTLSPGGTSSLVTHGRNTQYPLVGIYATSSVSLGQFVKVNFVNTTQCSFTLDSNVGSSITFRYIIR
jgi:hypothetical protein